MYPHRTRLPIKDHRLRNAIAPTLADLSMADATNPGGVVNEPSVCDGVVLSEGFRSVWYYFCGCEHAEACCDTAARIALTMCLLGTWVAVMVVPWYVAPTSKYHGNFLDSLVAGVVTTVVVTIAMACCVGAIVGLCDRWSDAKRRVLLVADPPNTTANTTADPIPPPIPGADLTEFSSIHVEESQRIVVPSDSSTEGMAATVPIVQIVVPSEPCPPYEAA